MECDLCGKRDISTIRVNAWIVCNTCSKSAVLADALDAQAQLDTLRGAIRQADIDARHATDLKEQAERRIEAAEKELAAAITAVMPLIASSARADDAADKARELLAEFEKSESGLKVPRQHA